MSHSSFENMSKRKGGGAQIKGMVSLLPKVNYMLVDVENIRKIEGLRADLAFSYNLIVKYLASISPSEMT